MRFEPGRSFITSITKILCITVSLGLYVSGCASVKLSMPGADNSASNLTSGVRERSALISATRQLERTPWPEVAEESLSDRMVSALFGKEPAAADGINRDAALNSYLATLTRQQDPTTALMNDANVTLRQARQVAESGRLAAAAMTPSSNDISVLENAISDVRQCREMYLDALRQLRRDGHAVNREREKELKEAFSRTIQDIGATADIVAERVAEGRVAPQYANQTAADGN